MNMTIERKERKSSTAIAKIPEVDTGPKVQAPRLTSEEVWHQVRRASFAVLGYVTPGGKPRASGVMYKVVGRRLFAATAPDSWKARHIPATGRVSVTVPVRRGGLLSLLLPIPPATVSFHGTAIVHPSGSPEMRPLLDELKALLPADRQDSVCIIEIAPEGTFVTYGVGVSLKTMRDVRCSAGRNEMGT